MKKTIILLIYILSCFNIIKGQDSGTVGIPDNSSSELYVPGPTKILKQWNEDEKSASQFEIPTGDYISSHIEGEKEGKLMEFNKDEFIQHGSIKITRGRIDAEGSHYKDNNHYRYSYKWESVKVTDGLEWSFNKTSWNSCNGFYINEVLPEVRYGNQYNVTFTFESKSIEIDANKLWTDGVMKNDYAKKEFDEKGTITLYFRFSNSVEVKYEMNSGNIGTMTGYFHQGSEYAKLITINRCNAGTLKVNGEGKNPAINNNPENGYAIYEEQTSNIDVTSFVEQHEGSEVVDLVDDSRESKPQNSQLLKGQIDNSIEISYFTYSSLKLIPGKEFTVQRKIVNGSCRSNTLKFKVLPKPIIEGINEDRDHTYCHSGKIPVAGTSVGVHYSTNGDGFATLYGKKCVLGNYNQYMSTYGIKYQWEYWTDFNPVPQTIPLLESDDMVPGSPLQIYDFNNDQNGPDLIFPIYALRENVTYYFRQKVILENFEEKIVRPSEGLMGDHYVVRLAKTVKPEHLTLDISEKSACKGDNLNDIVFTAKYEDENPSEYNLEKFKFNYTINGEKDSSNNEVNTKRNFTDIQSDILYTVSMEDGCGNEIAKEETTRVSELPAFTVENIKTTSNHISLSISDEDGEDYLVARGIRGRECKLTISDPQKSTHDYYYSPNEDGTELTKITSAGHKSYIKDTTLYFYKKAKNGTLCLSKPVKVQFVGMVEVSGNRFRDDTIYVCPGSVVPALNSGNAITDPEMGSIQRFKYQWIFSTDGISWSPMKKISENGEETIFTNKNYDGSWSKIVNEGERIYIKRVATPLLESGDGDIELGSNESNILTITTYSNPNPLLSINGKFEITPRCWGDTLALSMSAGNNKLLKQQDLMVQQYEAGQCLTNYGYYNYDGEKEKYIVLKTFKDKATDWKMPAKQYYMIHSAVEFCGDTIFSSQPIEVETHKELSATTTVSTCKIVGNEVTIKAVEDGCDCKIIRGDEVFASVDGVSTAKIKLTEKKEYKYDVIVKSEETGCQVTLHKSIKESEIKDRKTSVEIGPSGVAAQTNVCAGTEIPLTSTKNDNEYASYSWSVNGDIKTGETKNTLNFTFPEAGKSYKVKRTCYYYEGTELCYTVTDSTTIETVGALEVPAIALSEDSVCNGEDVEVTVTAKGGGSGTVYDLVLMPGNLSQDKSVSKDGSLVFKVNKLTSDSTLYAVVTDNTCTNKNIYKAESQKAKVTVEKDLTMVIKPANSMITTEDFKDGKTTVSVVLENVSSGDVITYFLSNASTTTASTTITYNGSAFSLTIDSTMFDPDQKTVDLKVQRRGAKVGKCECSATYPFRLNEGFLGTPIIISNDKTDMIEVCAGQEVELSVDNANEITFGERSILEMADAQWKWFYGNSPMATGNTYKFTVDAGRAYSYTVVFSGKDAGGRTRRISSTPFIVKGGAGMKVGGISFEGYEQNYIEFCKGSKSEVAMSCGLDPDKVAMKWEYSHTAAVDDWAAVPAEWNGNKTTVAKSISVGVNNLGNKKTYFRVAAVDNCNTKSQSDNYLSVSFKTDVENPRVSIASSTLYSSDQPLPDSISFNRYYYHDEPYMFLGRGEVENLEGKKQKVFFGDDLHFGVNSVSVVRSEKAKISEEVCMSDTVDYTFSIYKKLTKPSLGGPADNFFCPNDGQTKYMFIVLNNSTGGDSATYKTTWQYKLKNSDDWLSINVGNNLNLFDAKIGELRRNEIGEYQQTVYIGDLSQTITFRAIVSCAGGYPGGYATSNEVTMNVYAPLKDNGIDNSTKEICYNSPVDTIKGYAATGGSGKYTYTWEWSKDTVFATIVKGEENDPYFAPTNERGKYNLKTTTYFRRKVTDDICKTFFYSNVKKVVVKDSFIILPEDIDYDRVASNGSRAGMTGITDFSQSGTGDIQYIWWKTENKEYDRSAVNEEVWTEPLNVPNDDNSYVQTYYVQSAKGRCSSSNKLPIDIYVYNQTGGHIYVEDYDPEKGAFWTCSGMNNIQIASDDYAPNASFTWFYQVVNDPDGKSIRIKGHADGRVSVNVTSPEVRLDTTDMILTPFPLKNTTGKRKTVRIYRRTEVEAGGVMNYLYSDTVEINIVPTIESVNNALFADSDKTLADEISIIDGKKNYCLGDSPNKISGNLEKEVADYWDDYKNYIGPWLYDKSYPGGFKTYYEYQKNNGDWIHDTEYDYSLNQYAGSVPYEVKTALGELDGTYRVRRVMDDGCSTFASNEVVLSLFEDQLVPDSVTTYAFTPEMTSFKKSDGIKSGYEIGDSIVFFSNDNTLDLVWYLDPECTEILASGERTCPLRLTNQIAEQKFGDGAYVYVKARREECLGEAVAIPFEYGTESNGGAIFILDSIICQNETYSDVLNKQDAEGMYMAPKYGAMNWTYTWQYKRSRDSKVGWSNIEGETGTGLSADIINEISSITITDSTPLLIRRVATNDKGRVRYSNTLTLTRYKKLTPGTLSLNKAKNKFCAYDTLPYVKKGLTASGGKVYGSYNVTWQYNVNGGDWKPINAIDSLYVGWLTDSLDRAVNNTINVRCIYADECEEAIGEPVQVTLYRTSNIPSIYQNSDSCNAESVILTVYKDEFEKTYHWYAIAVQVNEDSTYTEDMYWHRTGDDNFIKRNTSMPADYYGVRSEDMETGCFSDFYYFYVDSLPKLDQSAPIAPIAICPNTDLEIKGGTLSGGNGEKSFQWQISLTGKDEEFSDIVDGTMEDLQLSSRFIKTASYFRRIVTDMCDADTSDIVLVNIRSKANVSPEDLSFDDFKCPLGIFSAKVVAEMDSLASSEYWTLGDDTISVIGKSIQMEGFEGDSMSYPFTHFVTDSTGLTCQSDVIYVTAHNKPAIIENTNIITTENYKPCIGSTIRINGSVLGGLYPEQVKYTWYVNGNEQIGEFGSNLRTTAKLTMSIFRVADNGCIKDSSNTLKLEGQSVYDFDYSKELSMSIESNVSDSSVVLNIQGSRSFDENYYFSGDGELPVASSNSILLPYKYDVYKDSILEIYAKQSYCVEPFVVNPLRGGVISIDGDTVLCGGSKISPIVATELEDGLEYVGLISYRWQYKNERTGDFINIDNATGKYYTPSVIDIPTTYRRLAYTKNKQYMSISNELTITIKSLVTMTGITTNYSDSELDDFGLDHSQTSVLKTASLPMYLQDSVFNADRVLWQKSHDLNEWNTVETMERNSTNLYEMRISDTALIVYYRVIGLNDCGADTSKVFTVKTDIAPLITDDELVLLDTICDGDKFARIAYKNPRSDVYRYSYSLNTQNFLALFDVKSSVPNDRVTIDKTVIENDESLIEDGLAIFIPRESFDVTITRHVIATGATSKKVVHFVVDHFSSSFKYIVDGASEYPMGKTENSVRLNQGSKVSFIAEATSDVMSSSDISYKWYLIEPLNLKYYSTFGGSVGIEGLTSKSQSPSCYFYNAGTYNIRLEVTDGICKSTMSDSALYIDKSTVRSYKVAAAFADEDDVFENEAVDGPLYVDVTPTLVKTSFDVFTNMEEGLPYEVTDEVGLKVKEGILSKTERIDATAWRSGVYIVNVNGMIFKVIKM